MFRPLAAISVAFFLMAPALAQVAPAKNSAITSSMPAPDDRARQWLTLVDDGDYAKAWSESGSAFKAHQDQAKWAQDAAATRGPLGAMASRDLKTIDLGHSNVALIHYDCVFAHKAAATETVTLAFENGSWSVTSYAVQ